MIPLCQSQNRKNSLNPSYCVVSYSIIVKTRALRRKGVDTNNHCLNDQNTLSYCRRLLTAKINFSSYDVKDIKMSCRCFSAEFAYCEADITFFAARHDEDTRKWLFKDIDKWFSDPGDSRAYVLLGDAGIGKSVMAGALTQRARNKGHLGAAYFCRHNDGTRNNPRYLVGTIARQLCDCNSEISTLVGGEDGLKMILADSKLGVKELFTKLLEEPLGKCAPCQQRKLVIVDALDETEYESREDFLYVIKKALPRLPQWLLFFITSRPEDTVQSRLEKYNPCIRICAGDSDEQGFYQQHEQDIQLFLQKKTDFSYISYSVEQVTKKCNGLFLYAYYIAKVLKESNSHRVSQQTDLFPGDIDEFFQENFQRVFDKIGADLYRKLFGCIIAAPSPLPISFISFVLKREKSNLDEQEAIDAVSLFVFRTSDGTVKFLHNLIPVWLTDRKKAPRRLLIDEKVAVEYLRIIFIEIISTVVEETRVTLPLRDEDLERFVMHFAVRFLCHHVDQNSLADVFNWLINYRFLEKRIHSGRSEIYHVIEDFKLASSCLPAEETQQRNILQEISLALESDFHVLVECPHLLRSCFRNTLDGAGEMFSIPQVSAPCVEWNICNIFSAKTLSQCNCFATTSDKKTFAGAKGRTLFFFDASTLEALGGPFEVSRDVIQRINCLEFSPDDKFVFFGRLDKWFSVERGCVEDFHQFSENPGHHDWGRIVSNGQHIVVKRSHFSDLPKTCETKRCIEDLLSLWAVKEIDEGPDKEWTCSFRQLPEMVAGVSTMGMETNSLLGRLGINLMSCEVNAMHGSNYSSCHFCDQLKELTDPSKESSLASVRQLVIKLYRWIFRYQVWNLETGRPLLQDVFNQCTKFNPFTYFCHVTSAFDNWGKEIGCAGVDQVMSVCNIAVVTAIDTFCRLRFDWSKRTYVRLSEREMEWLRECLKEWMLKKRRSFRYFVLFLEPRGIFKSGKRTLFREWVFKETHEETLRQEERAEEKKLTEIVERTLWKVLKLKEVSGGEEEKTVTEMVERRLMEAWKVEEDLPWEEWKLRGILKQTLQEFWQGMKVLHLVEERKRPEMLEVLLEEFRNRMKFGFLFGKISEEMEDKIRIKESVSQILAGLRPGLWQLTWKWTLQLDLELFSDSFKRGVFLNFPKGFLDLVVNDISHGLSPRQMWMVSSREMGEIHLLRTGFHEQDSCDYTSKKEEYRITQAKYLTFTYDDLYVVYLSYEDLLHALSLQTGTVFTSVFGRNCCYFTRQRRVGYLFRSGTEERAIFLTSLLDPCKFFPVLPRQDGQVGETTAAIFSSSDTVKSICSESLITSWRLEDHNLGFSFEKFSESSSVGSRSQVIKIQNCVFSTDGKLLAFQQHTQIKQCVVEEFEKSQCIVFEADFSFTDLCLTFSSDGVFLLFSIQDNFSGQHFYVWDVQREVLSKSFSSPWSVLSIDSFCLSSDNRNLILCGGEYEIEIWEFSLYPRHLLKRICVERSFNPVKFSHCAVSQDTELLVCCLANVIFVHSLHAADIHSSKRVLRGHLGKIEFCKFLKRNRYLISYAVDGMVFLWDISKSKAIGFARIAKGREKILCMAVSPDEDRAVCFISPSRVCVLNFCNLKCALPADFFTAQGKGRIITAETRLLPVGQIPSTSNVPEASRLEDDQHGGFRSPDLEEQFLLTPEDLLDSDESDDCLDYDDSD